MLLTESISLAFESIRIYKVRAFLNLLSISIGVFAIMGAGTLIESINSTVSDELANLGENNFLITRLPNVRTGNEWRKYRKRKPITYSQFIDLKDKMQSSDRVTAQSSSGLNTVSSGNLSTDPDVSLVGTDENYFKMQNTGISLGRAFTQRDIEMNRNVAVIGNDVVVELFPHSTPLGRDIRIKNQSFTVIGILEEKGAILGQSQDNQVIIPLTKFLKYYAYVWDESLTITVQAYSREALVPTMDEAIGHMRSIRNVKPWEENTFEVDTNETISEQFGVFTGYLSIFGFICGFIALVAAGIGIMNMMLVTVRERTREIGIRKAVGAKNYWILLQFIIEAITLCWIGGLIGVLIGVIGAGLFGFLLTISLDFSEFWFVVSILICTFLGVVFGLYPAWKAARLDPIDALRYE